jgi:hypothetical protein
MSDRYSSSQEAIVDRDNRNMAQAGIAMSTEINSIWSAIDSGPIGIQSSNADIDSLSLGGGAFTRDKDTSNGSTLNFSWNASRFHNGMSLVTVVAGTITLAASTTNYIEVSRAGTVSSNTSVFTAGRLPLWTVLTGSGSYTDNNVVSQKPLLTLIGSNGVIGAMLSTPGQTKELNSQLGAIAATTSFYLIAPNVAGTITQLNLVNSATIAQSDTDYWTVAVTNLGAGGIGTTAMLDTSTVNTTKVTGGSGITANVKRTLALNGTSGNLNFAANDVLQLTFTKTGAPTSLANAMIRFDSTFQT